MYMCACLCVYVCTRPCVCVCVGGMHLLMCVCIEVRRCCQMSLLLSAYLLFIYSFIYLFIFELDLAEPKLTSLAVLAI